MPKIVNGVPVWGLRLHKSSAPGGYGSIAVGGHRRVGVAGRLRMEHVLVWESANGPVPVGMILHHRNHNPLDNSLENLQLVTPLEHRRIHDGCLKQDDGTWLKLCKDCGVWKLIGHVDWYYNSDGYPISRCKQCHKRKTSEYKRNAKDKILLDGTGGASCIPQA